MPRRVSTVRSGSPVECQARPDQRGCASCQTLAGNLIRQTLKDQGLSSRRAGILTEGVLANVTHAVDGEFPASTIASNEFPGLVSCESRRVQVAETAVRFAVRAAEEAVKE